MKKEFFMTLAAVAMFAGISADQPAAAPVQAAKQQEKSVSNLSSDEMAFAAKLNDKNRSVFSSQFSAEQRKAAMSAACTGASCASAQKDAKVALSADDAVQKVLKDGGAVAEKKEISQAPAAKPQTTPVK